MAAAPDTNKAPDRTALMLRWFIVGRIRPSRQVRFRYLHHGATARPVRPRPEGQRNDLPK
jgi:hypothetical protein